MTNKEKRAKKLDRRARVEAGKKNNIPKLPRVKKDKATPKNPQKPNMFRRAARKIGTKKAWARFNRIMRNKA